MKNEEDLCQKLKVKLIFRGAWNSLMAWPAWPWPPHILRQIYVPLATHFCWLWRQMWQYAARWPVERRTSWRRLHQWSRQWRRRRWRRSQTAGRRSAATGNGGESDQQNIRHETMLSTTMP